MILPSKHLSGEKSLLWVAGELLRLLDEPKPVSRVWQELKRLRQAQSLPSLTYEWFVLGLDLLYMLGAVELERGRLQRRSNDTQNI